MNIPDEAVEAATGVEIGDLNETVEAPWHLQPEEARRVLEAALPHMKEKNMSTCSSCNVERSTEPDYSPIQAITGQPFGWYSGDDGEMCPACFTDIFDTANRTHHRRRYAMWTPDEAVAELREAVTDEIHSVVTAFSDSQMEALLTGDLVAAHERVTTLTHSEETTDESKVQLMREVCR